MPQVLASSLGAHCSVRARLSCVNARADATTNTTRDLKHDKILLLTETFKVGKRTEEVLDPFEAFNQFFEHFNKNLRRQIAESGKGSDSDPTFCKSETKVAMKVLTVQDKVVCVGQNEPTVVVDAQQLTKEELNRGCPLGVSRITNYLYVCGAHALPGAVRVLHPRLIVSAAPELPPPPEDYVPRHFVPLLDTPNSDMLMYMDGVADLINEVVMNGGVVLVHCVAGVSRSVTLCLAYLVKWQKMTLRDAYHYMKQRRPQIRPNTGFFKQLIKYEERLFGVASVKMVYCEAIDKEIPDVYEPDYSGMTWFRQRYGPIEKC